MGSWHTDWKIDDTAWIHIGGPDNPLHEGKIVHIFELPHWAPGMKHYVVEIDTHIDPLLEVRSIGSMWKRDYTKAP